MLLLLVTLALLSLVVGTVRTTPLKQRADIPASRSPARPSIMPRRTTSPTPSPPAPSPSSTLEVLTQGKDATIATVAQALHSRNPELLRPLLLAEVTLEPQQVGGARQVLMREEAIGWLEDRWGAEPHVVDTQYVAHFALLRINTDGWAPVGPLQRGSITFNLYRFDDRGIQDAFHGQWQISAIVYE